MILQRGQTLIELIIAIAVITVGLMSAAGLVYSNLNLVDRDTDQAIVINFAREGVEVSKQIRDSNWLASLPFNQGMFAGTDYTATILYEGAAGTVPTFNFTANAITHENAKMKLKNNFFAQTLPVGTVATSTLFTRLVTLHPICSDFSILNSGQTCPAAAPQTIGIRVESRVNWTRKGIAKSTVVYEDLYDWR